jgi:plastocyanin
LSPVFPLELWHLICGTTPHRNEVGASVGGPPPSRASLAVSASLEVTMRRTGFVVALCTSVGLLVTIAATVEVAAKREGNGGKREVVIRDDCDPTDPAWAPTGGCNRSEGDVTFADFNRLLVSPLVPAIVGHPAWTFDPTYLEVDAGKRIKISNDGGRTHTFTEVTDFGGGRVPPLNGVGIPGLTPLTVAPACVPGAGAVDIPGGGSDVVDGLSPGEHKFQCCIHPWMRTLVTATDKKQ